MIDQDIQRRMDAYRGNPQMLMQRYQQNQQLIDLLALQKLKSEKEAAARSLQMAAAQSQGEPPTVAQQREQEVLGMTQREVAQQVGAESQRRQAQERKALQQLMGGIAGVPGAGAAMPERAMAAGGIVAFQEGGYNDMIRRQQAEKGSIYSREFGLPSEERAILQDPELVKQLVDQMTLPELQEFNRSGRRAIPERLKGAVTPRPSTPLTERIKSALTAPAGRGLATSLSAAEAGASDMTPIEPTGKPITAAPAGYLGEPDVSELAAMAPARAPSPTAPAPKAAPTPSSASATAGLPAAAPSNPQLEQLRAALMGSMNPDREALRRQYASLIPGLNQERIAARQRDIDELERLNREASDPNKVGLDKLIAFLSGGANKVRTSSALGGGAQSYLKYAGEQQAAQRARLKELTAAREGLRSLEEARELAQAQAGLKGFEAAEQGMRSAMPAAVSLAGAEMQAQVSRDNAAAQRAMDGLKLANSKLENELRRESIDLSKYLELSSQRQKQANDLFKSLREDFKNRQLTDAQIRASVDVALSDFDRKLAILGQKAGMPEARSSGVNLPSADAIQAELRRRGAQ